VGKVGGGDELGQLACLMHDWSPLPVKSSRKSMPSMIYISGYICHAVLVLTLSQRRLSKKARNRQ
jgi:hypothetical protein